MQIFSSHSSLTSSSLSSWWRLKIILRLGLDCLSLGVGDMEVEDLSLNKDWKLASISISSMYSLCLTFLLYATKNYISLASSYCHNLWTTWRNFPLNIIWSLVTTRISNFSPWRRDLLKGWSSSRYQSSSSQTRLILFLIFSLCRPFLHDTPLLFPNSIHRLHEVIITFIILNYHCNVKIQTLIPPRNNGKACISEITSPGILFQSQNDVRELLMYCAAMDANVICYISNIYITNII